MSNENISNPRATAAAAVLGAHRSAVHIPATAEVSAAVRGSQVSLKAAS